MVNRVTIRMNNLFYKCSKRKEEAVPAVFKNIGGIASREEEESYEQIASMSTRINRTLVKSKNADLKV